MSFKLATMDVGLTPPIAYKTVKAGEDVTLGEALALADGAVTKCGATTRPDFVAVGPKDQNGDVPVVQVQDYMEWETTLSAAGADLTEGAKVTLDDDAMQVTATTASGVATITRMDGTAAGSVVHVRL